ncbi:hypothetical protein [Prescottella equi]|uniref:hypothetical protein n=1 Tax=Rhodococcus hoagii TaxID=43767 RepID=UPI000A0FFBEE|nr:hypothetical protein [Prescottella equi]ORJ99856.1 hypothetical protein A6F58_00670 [Prescottella equi]
MTIDLDKLDAVAAGGHSHLLQCIEGFADGYFGGSDGKIDASHAEHFAKYLVESIECEDETLCLVEARVLSAVVAELREARATIERLESVILSSAGRMFSKNGGAGVPLDKLLEALGGARD